jgi:hypothetical protein
MKKKVSGEIVVGIKINISFQINVHRKQRRLQENDEKHILNFCGYVWPMNLKNNRLDVQLH